MNLIFNSNLSDIIGDKDGLIYKLKEDMQYFRNLTSGTEDKPSILIIGFNTFRAVRILNAVFNDKKNIDHTALLIEEFLNSK